MNAHCPSANLQLSRSHRSRHRGTPAPLASADRLVGIAARQGSIERAAVMTRDEVFPSKYLKAADLKGKPRIVTIESAPYEALKGLDGKETQKIVLYFKNVPKGLPLNATSMASATPPAVPIRKIGRDIGSSCTQLEQPWEERRWIASAPVRLLLLGRRQRHRRHRRQSLRVN